MDGSSADYTAVYLQQLAIDKSTSFRAKKPDQGGNVMSGAETADGRLFEQFLESIRLRHVHILAGECTR